MLFKCRTLTDCGQFLFTDSKLPPKPWWRDPISKFRNALNISQTLSYAFQIRYTGRAWAVAAHGPQTGP